LTSAILIEDVFPLNITRLPILNTECYVYADEILNDLSPTIKDKIERFIHQHETIMFTISISEDSRFTYSRCKCTIDGVHTNCKHNRFMLMNKTLSQGRNTRSLYEYAEEKGIIYVYADEILNDLSPTKSFKISSAYT
jgi:hypothetical protein